MRFLKLSLRFRGQFSEEFGMRREESGKPATVHRVSV